MKFVYVTNANIPDDWGHSVQVMNMSKSFAESVELTLVVPDRNINRDKNPFEYYGFKKSFEIKRLFCIDFRTGTTSRTLYYLRFISFYISVFLYFLFNKFDTVYSRDSFAPIFIKNIVLEKHSFPKNPSFLEKIAFKKAKKIIVLTSFLKKKFIDIGIKEENILVSPDAVDTELFENISNDLKRKNFGFSDDDFVIGYVGALKTMGMDKGLNDLFSVIKNLDNRFKCLIVGGWGEDLEYYKKLSIDLGISERVYFTGKILHKEVAKYMKLCDILTAPFPENEHYSYYMSPLKIFEYMASNVPIVTTDLPSIREILTDNINAVLVKASDTESIKEGILKIVTNKEFAKSIAKNAFIEVRERYTWKRRAQNILSFINENSSHNPNIQ